MCVKILIWYSNDRNRWIKIKSSYQVRIIATQVWVSILSESFAVWVWDQADDDRLVSCLCHPVCQELPPISGSGQYFLTPLIEHKDQLHSMYIVLWLAIPFWG